MKQLHYDLDAKLTDNLSYHQQSVRILTRTLDALNRNPKMVSGMSTMYLRGNHTIIMYMISSAVVEEIVTIDVTDMCSRMLTCLEAAVQNFLFEMDYDVTDFMYSQYTELQSLIKEILSHRIYWFEVGHELRPERLKAYFKHKKIWDSSLTEIHKVMACLSVVNDILKLQHLDGAYEEQSAIKAYAKHLFAGEEARKLLTASSWFVFNEADDLRVNSRLIRLTLNTLMSNFDLYTAIIASGSQLLTEFEGVEEDSCAIMIAREVVMLLTVMPITLGDDTDAVSQLREVL